MLSIFLSVLKVIGIVLLGIIGLIILILCLVLFVPIRYRFVVDKEKDEGFDVEAHGIVSYLLHLVNVHIDYPSDELFYIRVAFFRIYPKKEKVKKVSSKKKEKEKSAEEFFDEVSEIDYSSEESVHEIKESVVNDSVVFSETKEPDSENDEDNKKESIKDFWLKLLDIIKNFKAKLVETYHKICDVKENFDYYLGVLNSNTFNHAFNKCKKELTKIIKMILPKSVKGYLEFGGKEPSLTAQVFGAFSAFRTKAFKKFKLIPFLEEERFNGHIVIKGYFQLITILVIGIKVYFNKDIKKTLKLLKREKG